MSQLISNWKKETKVEEMLCIKFYFFTIIWDSGGHTCRAVPEGQHALRGPPEATEFFFIHSCTVCINNEVIYLFLVNFSYFLEIL